jgi:5-methylcytosine-specific restriction enzyme A
MPQRALPPREPVKRESAAARGYDRRWRKARAAYLATHPLCVQCEWSGEVTAATVVDHIVQHEGQQDRLFWDQRNWQALCKPCHDAKTMREGGWHAKKR